MDKYSIIFFIGLGLMFSIVLLFIGFMITQSFPDDVYSIPMGIGFISGLILIFYGMGKKMALADSQNNNGSER